MTDQSVSTTKKNFFKTKWGILVILLFSPFFLTYWVWKQHWNPKIKYALIGSFWLLIFIGSAINSSHTKETPNVIATQASSTVAVSQSPTAVPTSIEEVGKPLSNLFSQMKAGGDQTGTVYIETDDGNLQAIKQADGTWLVTKIHNRWPEFFVSDSVKRMSYDFIRDIYNSGYSIKQAGVTINGSGGKYYRAFLGVNQSNTNAEWKEYGPTNFYNWMKSVETTIDEPRENRTVIEENI